jgi:hypothetical protein
MRTHLALLTMIALAAPLAAQQQEQPATDRGPRTTTEQQTTVSQTEHNHPAPKAGEVAMIGCLMREVDYRKLHNETGGGDKEYVLVAAAPAPATNAAASNQQASGPGSAPAAVGTSGAAKMDFRVSGKLEPDMATGVGRMVEVVGAVDKDAKAGEPSKITASLWHPVGDFCPAGTVSK